MKKRIAHPKALTMSLFPSKFWRAYQAIRPFVAICVPPRRILTSIQAPGTHTPAAYSSPHYVVQSTGGASVIHHIEEDIGSIPEFLRHEATRLLDDCRIIEKKPSACAVTRVTYVVA